MPGIGGGQRYCILHRPPAGANARGAVLYVHPWCEEMNKSRRMVALQSRAFAAHGWYVLQIDLLGCGDSSGDFCSASWQAWVDDAAAGARWLRERVKGPLWLWGLRAGCLVVCDAARLLNTPTSLLFWQPVSSGRTVLQQFLMLRAAGALRSGGARTLLRDARVELAAGRAVEVAGYTMSPALAAGLEAATLTVPPGTRDCAILHVLPPTAATVPSAMLAVAKDWEDAGFVVRQRSVVGPPFWQTTEIEDAPELIKATKQVLDDLDSL